MQDGVQYIGSKERQSGLRTGCMSKTIASADTCSGKNDAQGHILYVCLTHHARQSQITEGIFLAANVTSLLLQMGTHTQLLPYESLHMADRLLAYPSGGAHPLVAS